MKYENNMKCEILKEIKKTSKANGTQGEVEFRNQGRRVS